MTRCALALALILAAAAALASDWSPVAYPGDFDNINLFAPADDGLYAGTFLGKVYRSEDRGASWTEVAGGLPDTYAPVSTLLLVDDWMLMSRGGFEEINFRSQKMAGEWTPFEAIPYQDDPIWQAVAIDGEIFAVLSGGVIHRSDDHGETWTPVTAPGYEPIWRLFTFEGRLFASEQLSGGGELYRSDDLGASWTPIGADLPNTYIIAQSRWQGHLLVSIYLGGGQGQLWSSDDWGAHWQQIGGLPTSYNLNGLAPTGDGHLVIGASGPTSGGGTIFLTDDLASWEDFTGNLPGGAHSVNQLVTRDGWLFKTGGSVTAYRSPVSDLTAADETPAASVQLAAHPNPFNPKTRVSFALKHAASIDLAVFDAAGRRLATLAQGHWAAGVHELDWTARDATGHELSSGIYIIKLSGDVEAVSTKVTLLR